MSVLCSMAGLGMTQGSGTALREQRSPIPLLFEVWNDIRRDRIPKLSPSVIPREAIPFFSAERIPVASPHLAGAQSSFPND